MGCVHAIPSTESEHSSSRITQMSRLWSHPLYADDQPHSPAILTTHVLFRGFQAGSLVAPLISLPRYFLLRWRSPLSSQPLFPYLIRSTGTGAVVGTGLLAIGLVARMWGREEIEWKDRAWRLLENKGQVEVDSWGLIGMLTGVALLGVRAGWRGIEWRTAFGSLGIGGTSGVRGYMVWRHGIHGGKWPNE